MPLRALAIVVAVCASLAPGCTERQAAPNTPRHLGTVAQPRPWGWADSLLRHTPDAAARMTLAPAQLAYRSLTLPGQQFDSLAALVALLPGLLAQIEAAEDGDTPTDDAACVAWQLAQPSPLTCPGWDTQAAQPFPASPGSVVFTEVGHVLRFAEAGRQVCRVVLHSRPSPPGGAAPPGQGATVGLADFAQTPGGWQLVAFSPCVGVWGRSAQPEPLTLVLAHGAPAVAVVQAMAATGPTRRLLAFARQGTGFGPVLGVPLCAVTRTEANACYWDTRLRGGRAATGEPTLLLETHGRWRRGCAPQLGQPAQVAQQLPRSVQAQAAQRDSFAFTLHREFRWQGQGFALAKEMLETR